MSNDSGSTVAVLLLIRNILLTWVVQGLQ